MIQGKRVTVYDVKGRKRVVYPHEAENLKKKGKVKDKPAKKEEKTQRTTKEYKQTDQTK